MKNIKIFLFAFICFTGCKSELGDSIWVIYNVSNITYKEGTNDSFALDYMVNEKLNGVKIIIKNKSIKFIGNDFDSEAEIVQITPKEILTKDKNKLYKIQYFLSDNNKECAFIFADGSKWRAKRED